MIWMLVLASWEAGYRIVHWKPWVFPPPSGVLDSLLGMLNVQTAFEEPLHRGWPRPRSSVTGDETGAGARAAVTAKGVAESPLVQANLVSAVRLAEGFAISIVLGATLGVSMWRFRWLDDLLGPVFLGLQTLPSVCWVPLAIIFFHYSEAAVVFVLIMGSFFAVAISLRDGLRTIPPLYQRAGLMLGARSWRLYRYVLLPASLPALASGLRQGFSFAWRSLMGAEFVLAVEHHGVGYLLQQARDFNDDGGIVAIMIIMVVIGMLADRLAFARLERKVQERFGLASVR
jgi:NitT/TauT family transport system permease protein